MFKRIVAVLRIAVPYTGMIMSTRESAKTREECLEIGITQISGGSRTSVGGYGEELDEDGSFDSEDTAQFDVEDRRTLGEVVDWLIKQRLCSELLHGMLPGGKNRRQIHESAQVGADS